MGAILVLLSAAPRPAAAQSAPDNRLDSIARLLAGLPPTHPDHQRLAATREWKEHSQALQASWQRVRDGQRAAMVTWRLAEIPRGCPVGKTLLYPFSGPDFLNAYWLFPECESMVLFGLERIGRVPEIESMSPKEFAQLLTGVRSFMINLFVRNYFVTGTMEKGFQSKQLQGLVPVFMVLMALSGAEVLRVAPLDVGVAAPDPAAAPDVAGAPPVQGGLRRELRGVTIDFRAAGSKQAQRLNYFSLDATDAGLARYPQFLSYLRGLAPTTTLIKSASYLLHGNQFGQMRDALLDASAFIVQDDTGMPYPRLLKRGWEVRVYGRYSVPIPPFEHAYQPSLAAAYQKANPAALPFRFGYQADSGENRSNLIVARLPSGRPQPAAGTGAR
jgi:hypothetical protein